MVGAAGALCVLAALVLGGSAAQGAVLTPVMQSIAWGETSDALARALGGRAVRLHPPIEFGDSYVDVGIRNETIAGYPFAVYFQMDKKTHGLKRVTLARQPHGANPKVFKALVGAFAVDYGEPGESCALKPSARTGYQAAVERIWHADGMTVRAVFRDTTLEAAEGCVSAANVPCGLAGRLYVQILPGTAGCE